MKMIKYPTIGKYIDSFSGEIQVLLKKMKKAIQESAPKAEEAMSYGMPTFKLNGNLVHFAAFKQHIGFFPTPSAIVHFKKHLSAYKTSKGTIQFPFDKPIPFELVKKIVKFRVKENMTKKPK